jgi:hypothetical protein
MPFCTALNGVVHNVTLLPLFRQDPDALDTDRVELLRVEAQGTPR